MSQTFLDYTAVEHLEEFLGLQADNAGLVGEYTAANTRFSDGLGWAVAPIGPVGDWVSDQGVQVAEWVEEFFTTVQRQLREVKTAVQEADAEAVAALWRLGGEMGETAGAVVDSFDRGLMNRAPAPVPAGSPISIAAPQAGRDPVQDINANLGAVVGTVDEIYGWLFGGSIIHDHVLGPLAGDWAVVQKSADAWGKAGAGYSDMAQQIVQYTLPVSWWEGPAAEAFQGVMSLVQVAADWMQAGYRAVGRGVDFVAETVIAGCEVITSIIGQLEEVALKILAKLKVPLVGWASLAVSAKGYIDQFRGLVDDVKQVIENIEAAIEEAKAMQEEFEHRMTKARQMYDWVLAAI